MKKGWGALALILIVLALCAFDMFYVMATSDRAIQKIHEMQEVYSEKNYEKATKISEELENFWENNSTLLTMLIHNTEVENVKLTISLVKTSLENESEPDFWLESSRALIYIQNLHKTEVPSLGNIF